MNKKDYLLIKLKIWKEIRENPQNIKEIIQKYLKKYPEISLKRKL